MLVQVDQAEVVLRTLGFTQADLSLPSPSVLPVASTVKMGVMGKIEHEVVRHVTEMAHNVRYSAPVRTLLRSGPRIDLRSSSPQAGVRDRTTRLVASRLELPGFRDILYFLSPRCYLSATQQLLV